MRRICRVASSRIALFAFCAVFAAGEGRADVTYSVRDLGSLGGASARAYAINEHGWVVGEAETRDGYVRAFLWTPEAGMQDLGSLGGASSRAFAINDRGEAGGEAQDKTGRFRPFRWSADYGMEALPTPPGIRDAFVYSMNNFGVLVGGADGPLGPRALVWSVDGVATPAPLERFSASVAHAVNDLGVIVGRVELPGLAEQVGRAFIGAGGEWRVPSGGAFDSADSAALALNSRGDAVGYRAYGRSLQAAWFSPDSSHAPRGIDTLDNVYSVAYDINDRGEVVGLFSSSPEDDDRAFVWRDGVMLDLNEWIESAEPWHIIEARGINNRGEIVGYGLLHERERAVLLAPRPRTDEAVRPAVRIVAPPSGTVLEEGADLTLEAAVTPVDARVRRVIYYANGVVIGSSTTAPHRLIWQKPPAGVHHVVAVLIGADGRMRRSERIAVTVALKDDLAATANP